MNRYIPVGKAQLKFFHRPLSSLVQRGRLERKTKEQDQEREKRERGRRGEERREEEGRRPEKRGNRRERREYNVIQRV